MRDGTNKGSSADTLRITAQFRVRNGMAYELRAHGARLTILMTRADPSSPWSCEAFTEPSLPVATFAATRAAALQTTSAAWRNDSVSRGLPSFDWDEVTRVLANVRAI